MRTRPPIEYSPVGHVFSFCLVAALWFVCFLADWAAAEPLTPKEELGKEIYLRTVSPSGGEISAFVGIASVEAPGSAMPCVSCHAANGRGRPESDITPSNITWKELTKPYKVRQADGRSRPPYTEETLARAITEGIDSGGNRLHPAMPLYRISETDLSALISYIKRLGTDFDPGVMEKSIRIGTILPVEGSSAELGAVVGKTIQAAFDEINSRGGIYDRRLELVVGAGSEKEPLSIGQVERFIRQNELFLLVSTFTPGLVKEVSTLAEAETIPIVGPIAVFQHAGVSLNRYTFHIFPGLVEQARALVDGAALVLKRDNPEPVVVYPAGRELGDVVEAVEEQSRTRGWSPAAGEEYHPEAFNPAETVRALITKGAGLVFFFGSEPETNALMKEAEKQKWAPFFFLSGSLSGRAVYALPPGLKDRAYLAYPSVPENLSERGLKELGLLARKHRIPAKHQNIQVSAYTSVKVMVEGLRRCGRELSREAFVSALEKVHELDTGLAPPISFGPNRRIGVSGSYIVTVNPGKEGAKDFIASKTWVVPK